MLYKHLGLSQSRTYESSIESVYSLMLIGVLQIYISNRRDVQHTSVSDVLGVVDHKNQGKAAAALILEALERKEKEKEERRGEGSSWQ